MRRKVLCVLWVVALSLGSPFLRNAAAAGLFETSVAVVNYDLEDARLYGDLPDRMQIARIIDAMRDKGAKTIVVKFFFDQAKGAEDDLALAYAVSRGHVILQASISADPPTTTLLKPAFFYANQLPASINPRLKGDKGWLPTMQFQTAAYRVCFADVADLHTVPLLERFDGRPVETLYSCIAEEILDAPLKISDARRATYGMRSVHTDQFGEIPVSFKNAPLSSSISVRELLTSSGPDPRIAGKVAILVYSGPKTASVDIDGQEFPVHAAFLSGLKDFLDSIRPR